MRIWSLHPKHLDSKGLVALWRETLLAKKVLEGKTIAYKNHPQLNRFKELSNPVYAIDQYLSSVYAEALGRGYKFDRSKINWNFIQTKITVTKGQLDYEKNHLLKKLKERDIKYYNNLIKSTKQDSHPMFDIIDGGIESWEKI